MKDVQCYELFGGIALKNHAFGLAKVYKKDTPLRPVVSMIRTAEYNPAKYLVKIMNDAIPPTYMLNSTGSYANQISSFYFKPSHVLVSYDVVSLFTNIPLHETRYCFHLCISTTFTKKYSKETFEKHVQIATADYFYRRRKIYCQIDGVTMGSQLGPTLANFLGLI